MLSVVCPVYNEAENIGRLLDQVRDHIAVPLEILVVYDRAEDTTIPVVERIAPGYAFEIRLVRNHFDRGVLNAIKTGFREAQHEAVLVVMADLSDDFRIVNEMYRLVVDERYDVVCGSRYMRGGRHIGGPLWKRTMSRAAGLSLFYLGGLPVHDITNSFRMYRREFLRRVEIESRGGFEIGMELAVKAFATGGRMTELPSVWMDRMAGGSRFQFWSWLPGYLRWYFYALRHAWGGRRRQR